MLDDVPMTVVKGFAIAGALLVIPVVYRLLSFIWIYFIRPSSIRNYLTDTAPYALVTGASDGIGKGSSINSIADLSSDDMRKVSQRNYTVEGST
jgi:hypothetical protein